MSKCIYRLNGNFHSICNHIKREILSTSTSASIEEEEYLAKDNIRIGIMAFERYSYSGGNRLSLNVTIIENNNYVDIIGISTGGSNGLFMKFNTWGEEAFLDKLKEAINKF